MLNSCPKMGRTHLKLVQAERFGALQQNLGISRLDSSTPSHQQMLQNVFFPEMLFILELHFKRRVSTCIQLLQSIFQGKILLYLLRFFNLLMFANWADVSFLEIFSKQDTVLMQMSIISYPMPKLFFNLAFAS